MAHPPLRHLRSAVDNARPDGALMAEGQIAMNYAAATPAMFIKDSAGQAVKIGPTHVGAAAPNAVPAGAAGNSVGESWLDTSTAEPVFKVWDGAQWVSAGGGGGATVTTDDVPPAAPADGDLWWDSASTTLFVWYDDGDSAQWVQIGGGAGGGGGGSAQVTDTPPATPAPGDLWWDAATTMLFVWYDDGDSAQWVQASPTQPGPAGADSTVPGPQGIQGEVGPQGPAGVDGAVGPAGPAGPTAVSADAGNRSALGTDGLLYTPAQALLSADAGNRSSLGTDGLVFTAAPPLLSADAGNTSVLGADGLVFTPATAVPGATTSGGGTNSADTTSYLSPAVAYEAYTPRDYRLLPLLP